MWVPGRRNIPGQRNKTEALRQKYAGHVQEIAGKFMWLDQSNRKGECQEGRRGGILSKKLPGLIQQTPKRGQRKK